MPKIVFNHTVVLGQHAFSFASSFIDYTAADGYHAQKSIKEIAWNLQYLSSICLEISIGIIITVCLWCHRHRGAQINPQDTHSVLHFRMTDKQQHLVTFCCSYGGFNPLLRAAPCCWLQQTGGQWALEVRWDFFCRTPAQKFDGTSGFFLKSHR